MESKICSMCNLEKHIKNFKKNFSECKACSNERSLKKYYKTTDDI